MPYVLERYKHRAVDTLVLEGKTSPAPTIVLCVLAVDTLVLEGKTSVPLPFISASLAVDTLVLEGKTSPRNGD